MNSVVDTQSGSFHKQRKVSSKIHNDSSSIQVFPVHSIRSNKLIGSTMKPLPWVSLIPCKPMSNDLHNCKTYHCSCSKRGFFVGYTAHLKALSLMRRYASGVAFGDLSTAAPLLANNQPAELFLRPETFLYSTIYSFLNIDIRTSYNELLKILFIPY